MQVLGMFACAIDAARGVFALCPDTGMKSTIAALNYQTSQPA